MYLEIFNKNQRLFQSGSIPEGRCVCFHRAVAECQILGLISLDQLKQGPELSLVLYYGNDNYIGETEVNVNDLATMDETSFSVSVVTCPIPDM